MKKWTFLIIPVVVFASSCGTTNSTITDLTDSARYENRSNTLTAKMIPASPGKLRFTVHNQTDSTQTFLKWHTPFEPLLSKYLDIRDSAGKEINYVGAMAKRRMPPPAADYIPVAPGDSISVLVNLAEGYALTQPGVYSVSYNGGDLSKLRITDTIKVSYE